MLSLNVSNLPLVGQMHDILGFFKRLLREEYYLYLFISGIVLFIALTGLVVS